MRAFGQYCCDSNGVYSLLKLARKALETATAEKDQPGKMQAFYEMKHAVSVAEKIYKEKCDAQIAAKAKYDAVHTKVRRIELQNYELTSAICSGKTLETYRAEVQHVKDQLIAYAQKMITQYNETKEWTDGAKEDWKDAAEEARDLVRGKSHIIHHKVLFYLMEGVDCRNVNLLQTFVERMAY